MNRASALPVRGHFIAGRVIESAGGADFETLDPSTEEPLARVARAGAVEVDAAVAAAHQAFRGPWKEVTPAQRGALLYRLAEANVAIRLPSAEPSA
jgi:aldehyde dehydrogenase (NAD+)